MTREQILIFDCQNEIRPAVCFTLEVSGYQMRIVTEEDEAVNLLDNARLTGERFVAFVVNNPFLNVDISKLIQNAKKISKDIPVVVVKDSANMAKIVETIAREHKLSGVYFSKPTKVAEVLATITGQDGIQHTVDGLSYQSAQ